jgi:glycerol kinase
MNEPLILALDQGTTGSTALLVDAKLNVVARANVEFPQIYPRPGWVEHDPEAIWGSQIEALAKVLEQAPGAAERIAGIGITNQRETTILWERETGAPVHNAIVWQCRRTAERCAELNAQGHGETVRRKTGLVIDAYFSGTKLAWLLDNVEGARARAKKGQLAFGTVDSFLVWRLTGGAVHVSDASNASRTMLYNIHDRCWDESLLGLLEIPRGVLPEVWACSEVYGHTKGVPGLRDGIPVAGMAGDQQAALFGQACFAPGDIKCTYGTGAFVLQNTGSDPVASEAGLLTTIAWTLGDTTTYALEGSIFVAGAAVQWLRDELGLIEEAAAIEALAASVESSDGVVVVPAFVGLGAPHWDGRARGAVLGLTRGSGRAQLARATLEGVAHACDDVIAAMAKDSGQRIGSIKVDGGAARNDLLMQMQADLANTRVVRPSQLETTALGAACLAGLAVGVFESTDDISARWQAEQVFENRADPKEVEAAKARWKAAVAAVRGFGLGE